MGRGPRSDNTTDERLSAQTRNGSGSGSGSRSAAGSRAMASPLAKETYATYQKHLAAPLSRVQQIMREGGEMNERGMVAAWRKLYADPRYSRPVGTGRKATPAWTNLQIEMCRVAKMATDVIREESLTDPKHPVRRMLEDVQTNFVMANDGFLRTTFVHKHGSSNLLEGESDAEAREIVLNQARAGMAYGMARFDPNKENRANPLSYTANWARAFVTRNQQKTGRTINFRSGERDRRAVAIAVRDIENEGRSVSVAEIASRTRLDSSDVLELLPHTQNIGHLDAPVRGAEDESLTMGALVADQSVDIAGAMMDRSTYDAINAAAEEIANPYHRAVLEMLSGLGGRERAGQSDLFDGVFVDQDGNQFSARQSIRRAEHRLGPNGEEIVKPRAQSELSRALREGRMRFIPGTPEAAELVRIVEEMTGTPWAPTSGSVQDAKMRAEEALIENPKVSRYREALRYRGDNIIENSGMALDELREALVSLDVVTASEAARLRTGSLSAAQQGGDVRDRKGSARILGEKHGLIVPSTGRFTAKAQAIIARNRQQAENAVVEDEMTSDDYADLMSSV
jgi:hypothetical protein